MGDITLYAQWIESTNCTVTFVYGDATFDGTNYINSGIPLFSSDNIHRDFEVRSTISDFTVNPGQDNNRNALICNQNEVKDPYPGFALSYREDKDTDGGKAIKIQGNCTSTAQAMVLWGKTAGTIVFTRIDDKLLELLNELHEEAQSSKEFIEQLQQELVLFKKAGADMGIDLNAQITALKQENEQLKKELDQFYLLIGRGDWSGLVDLIKGDVE